MSSPPLTGRDPDAHRHLERPFAEGTSDAVGGGARAPHRAAGWAMTTDGTGSEVEKLAAALARGDFPPSATPTWQIRIAGAESSSAVWTWTRARGLERGAAVAPTCVLEVDAQALGDLVSGRVAPDEIHEKGRLRLGGLLSDVRCLALLFSDPATMKALAASAPSTEQKRELVKACEGAMLEIAGERSAFRRVTAMLEAWAEHAIGRCRLDQWLMVDVPELEMLPWVDAGTLGIEDLVEAAFPELRREAAKLASREVIAPRYGRREADDAPLPLNPEGWRHWNLVEGFEWIDERCRPFPETRRAIEAISRRLTILHAGFLVLEPGAVILEHADGVGWALSYSHGLIVPDGCYLKVAGESRAHRERGSLLFNDSFVHSAGNRGDATRVLFAVVCINPAFSPVEAACLRKATSVLPKGEICYPA